MPALVSVHLTTYSLSFSRFYRFVSAGKDLHLSARQLRCAEWVSWEHSRQVGLQGCLTGQGHWPCSEAEFHVQVDELPDWLDRAAAWALPHCVLAWLCPGWTPPQGRAVVHVLYHSWWVSDCALCLAAAGPDLHSGHRAIGCAPKSGEATSWASQSGRLLAVLCHWAGLLAWLPAPVGCRMSTEAARHLWPCFPEGQGWAMLSSWVGL